MDIGKYLPTCLIISQGQSKIDWYAIFTSRRYELTHALKSAMFVAAILMINSEFRAEILLFVANFDVN
jgi:hypothetical protein